MVIFLRFKTIIIIFLVVFVFITFQQDPLLGIILVSIAFGIFLYIKKRKGGSSGLMGFAFGSNNSFGGSEHLIILELLKKESIDNDNESNSEDPITLNEEEKRILELFD